jgi:hypothetical protein
MQFIICLAYLDDEKCCVCKLFTPKRSQREPMFNIHKMLQMQTLGSFDLLYWKTCDYVEIVSNKSFKTYFFMLICFTDCFFCHHGDVSHISTNIDMIYCKFNQTLGSFDLLYWKTCDQERWWIFMPPLQELLVLKSWYH